MVFVYVYIKFIIIAAFHKHIVKHIVKQNTCVNIPCRTAASYLGLRSCGSLRVNGPFLGALCPSMSGLMNKHTVKHLWCPVPVFVYLFVWGFVVGLGTD